MVYEWALGTPFEEICTLTDVMEGSIVRAVVRLDQVGGRVGRWVGGCGEWVGGCMGGRAGGRLGGQVGGQVGGRAGGMGWELRHCAHDGATGPGGWVAAPM